MARYLGLCLMMLSFKTASVQFWGPIFTTLAPNACYPDVGCFDPYFPCAFRTLPENPSEINTQFFLYTPENPLEPEIIDYKDDDSISTSSFRANRGTKFIIYGFLSNIMRPEFLDLKNAFLSFGNFNVVLVDWTNGADMYYVDTVSSPVSRVSLSYDQAGQNGALVGRQIGLLSRKLNRLTNTSFASMHLIGHSLGAQVAGFAGAYLSGQYGRITGLNPAWPGFRTRKRRENCELDRSDAIFVDTIHTDHGGLQSYYTTGHQNFFPNGGLFQAGCGEHDEACHNYRAVEYFTESITSNCTFLAYPCSFWHGFRNLGQCRGCGSTGCSRMGYYANLSSATGSFMLGTNTDAPYCREDSGIPIWPYQDTWRP